MELLSISIIAASKPEVTMKSRLIKYFAASSLLILFIPSAMAHGISFNYTPPKYSYAYPSALVYGSGPKVFIRSSSVYSSGYPGYGYSQYSNAGYKHGQKYNAWPQYHQKKYKKILPSTHIYGAYPFKEPRKVIRVNPHASSYQKKHAYGYDSYGYNHYSPRGNGRWYK